MQISPATSSTCALQNKQQTKNTSDNFARRLDQAENLASTGTNKQAEPAGLLPSLFRHGSGGAITIDDLKAEIKEDKCMLLLQAKKLLAENDIDTSRGINLSTDEQGRVIVTNAHPDKEKIEKIFEENSELSNLFRKISSMESIVRHSQAALAFQSAYARNPQAAVAQYAYLFNDNASILFNMLIEAEAE